MDPRTNAQLQICAGAPVRAVLSGRSASAVRTLSAIGPRPQFCRCTSLPHFVPVRFLRTSAGATAQPLGCGSAGTHEEENVNKIGQDLDVVKMFLCVFDLTHYIVTENSLGALPGSFS